VANGRRDYSYWRGIRPTKTCENDLAKLGALIALQSIMGAGMTCSQRSTEPKDEIRSAYYESDEGGRRLSGWYKDEKEVAFLDFIFEGLVVPSSGAVVEIGGGAGIHGRILARRFGSRYLFTDLSGNLVRAARRSGLPAEQMDGLAMKLGDGSAACAVLVATSTLIYGPGPRRRQFSECARILQPGGIAIFVGSRWDRRYHTWDQEDAKFLTTLGLSTRHRSWGIIPGRLWNGQNKRVFRVIEKIAAMSSFSGRSVLIASRPTGS
jgi:SAM-dependent methyltransferase